MKKSLFIILTFILALSLCIFQMGCDDDKPVGENTAGSVAPGVVVSHSFTINKNDVQLEQGQTFWLVASYGTSKLSYASDNPQVATISEEGLITAVETGVAYITVTSNATESKGICKVTVIHPEYTVKFNSEADYSVFVGAHKFLSVTTLKDGVEYIDEVTWSVTDGAEIIEENGLTAVFVADTAGTYVVNVTSGKNAQCQITITVLDTI